MSEKWVAERSFFIVFVTTIAATLHAGVRSDPTLFRPLPTPCTLYDLVHILTTTHTFMTTHIPFTMFNGHSVHIH
jgi:hypothetical protein